MIKTTEMSGFLQRGGPQAHMNTNLLARLRTAGPLVFVLLLLLAFGAPNASAQSQSSWSVGYYVNICCLANTGYPLPSTIDFSAVTHLIMSGNFPQSNGSISTPNGFGSAATSLIAAAHANGVKVLFGMNSPDFPDAANSSNLNTFISNIMNIVNTYGFDGVDVDWEDTWNQTEVTSLVSGLRSALGSRLLTATGGSYSFGVANTGIPTCNTPNYGWTLAQVGYLDKLLLMAYDLNGSWNPQTWYSAPLYSPAPKPTYWSLDFEVKGALGCGIAASKILAGLPFYGYLQTGNTGIMQSFNNETFTQLAYNQIVTQFNLSSAVFDTNYHTSSEVVSGTSGCQQYQNAGACSTAWLNYPTVQSTTDAVAYANTQGLGGWFFWYLGADYMPNSSPTMPLMEALKTGLNRPAPPSSLSISVN